MLNICFVLLLQAGLPERVTTVSQVSNEMSYLSILMKGGWIMAPLLFLSLVSIYVIIERWVEISKAGKKDQSWFPQASGLISEGKIETALNFCAKSANPSARVIAAGLRDIDDDVENIQESMQVEARQQIAGLEHQMNYLGIISSIAPMLGFLGTIFGVIKIFYNISVTNNLDIATISDGLYQKMICSGAGLLIGIIAYSAYYLLNGKIDKIVARMDSESNDMFRYIRSYKTHHSLSR